MKRIVCLAAVALLAGPPARAAEALPDFIGRVTPQLVLEREMRMPVKLVALTAEQAAALPAPLAAGDLAYEGEISFPLPKPMRVVLVRPQKGEPFVYVDRDQDSKLSAEERFALPAAEEKAGTKGAAISLPQAKGPFPSYPLEIFALPDSQLASMPPPMKQGADAMLLVASLASIEGRVPIDGRELLVRIHGGFEQESCDPRYGTIGMDVNGDGKIDPTGNLETDAVQGEDAIFKVGERYVSVGSVDLAAGRMVLKSHPASDYQGVDLTPGHAVPDFSFVDLDGKPHKLSDWRGRHLLLDFWATWCAPCIAEFPALKKAHEQYRGHGLEIVGVIYQDDADRVRKFLADPAHQIPWLQATSESTAEMVSKRLRIRSVPAILLIDPQGNVISDGGMDQPGLHGDQLEKTLAKVFGGGGKPGEP